MKRLLIFMLFAVSAFGQYRIPTMLLGYHWIPKQIINPGGGGSGLPSGCTGTTGNITCVTLGTSGSNGGIDGTEGTGAGLTAATSHDLLYPSSSSHCWLMNNNNGGATGCVADLSKAVTAFTGTIAANTEVANVTGSSAAPTAAALPAGGTNGCSGSTDAAIYTAGTGWGCHQIAGGGGSALTTWYTASSSAGFESGSTAARANGLVLSGVVIPSGGLSVGHITFLVTAGDGTNNTAICVYTSAGVLEAQTTAAHLSGTGNQTYAFTGTATITAGRHYIGIASVGSTYAVTARIGGSTFYASDNNPAIVTTAGACPASITPPSDIINLNGATLDAQLVP